MELIERIEIDPGISFGKPVIRGTRHFVDQVLEQLSGGTTIEELLAGFPNLTRDDVHAALLCPVLFIRRHRGLGLA